jgi:hypothetical protein
MRQSMPSSGIERCVDVRDTLPGVVCGQPPRSETELSKVRRPMSSEATMLARAMP